MDPSTTAQRFPGNNVATAISRLPFTVTATEGGASQFTDDGNVALYLTGVSQEPAFISRRKAITWAGGNSPSMRGEQQFDSESDSTKPFLAPLFFGDKTSALFSEHIVSATGEIRPGYRCTVSTNTMVITVAHTPGFVGFIDWWYRNNVGAFVSTPTSVAPTTTFTNINIVDGATAFGLSLRSTLGFTALVAVCNPGAGAHGLTLGNHAGNCIAIRPDYTSMGIKRGRTIGLSAHLRYDGDVLNNGGATTGVQFSPGTYPTEFAGSNLADQIVASGLQGVYKGHFKDGMHAKYVHNSPANYIMSPVRSQSGLLCLTWSGSAAPMPWTVFFNQVIEFTTSVVAFEKKVPPFALPADIAVAIADLNRIQLITANDTHDFVMKLWRQVRSKAYSIAKSPKTWHTIAEVGAGVAGMLL